MSTQRKLLGEILLELGLVSRQQLDDALQEQAKSGERLGNILVNNGVLTEQQLVETLEFTLGIPHVQLDKANIDPAAVKLIPPAMIRSNQVLPLSCKNGNIILAMADPLNYQAIDDVRMAAGMDVVPVLAGQKELDTAIRQYLVLSVDPAMERILGEMARDEKSNPDVVKDSAVLHIDEDAPVIRMVNSIFTQAIEGRASDIHFEPQENSIRIRFRIDGQLYEVLSLPAKMSGAIISRIKIMANMDIAEKRIPQDGRMRITLEGRAVDFRISTLPTMFGEKAVLRILDRDAAVSRVDQLGLSSQNRNILLSLAHHPHGLLLVTGPTGSGKTTTLYSILSEINSTAKNIITLEDPIEYSLPGINQMQVNLKAGLTFAAGLRSVLRQDPDIIMVGEIRDHETAQLAVQAALTGHLVLSTLHTNSAAGAIARLLDMGIESFLLASSLIGVVSQRMVRRLCPKCRQSYLLDEETALKLGIAEESGQRFFRAQGCNMCRQLGYRGRLAIHEIVTVGSRLREEINHGDTSEAAIENTVREEGMITIQADGVEKARQGITSLEEVMQAVLWGG